ncbi:ribbon-helix-helix protein, CopG family [Leptolyngbya sp. FACHB-541]|uniref:ribbon-helix-helix protein, CopG family n=1 Tax=Leptolyngbya sp. FACHB-541 TaxID=2692810 RepID=UPI00168505F3|nr:ribbon-helix-helix protein, CopG family [Leptolyngbya sp. FACHB-541]
MSRQPNPKVSTRVSPEWKARIEAIANKTGRNSSQVLHEAIALYLGENDASTVGVTLQDILMRLEALKQQAAVRVLLGR